MSKRLKLEKELLELGTLISASSPPDIDLIFDSFQRTRSDILRTLQYLDDYETFNHELHKTEDDFYDFSIDEIRRLKMVLIGAFVSEKEKPQLKDVSWAYKVLGSKPKDSIDEIKSNYKDLVKKNHPDQLNQEKFDKEITKFAEKRLREINEAWEIIQKDKKD